MAEESSPLTRFFRALDPTEMATKIKELLDPSTHTRLARDSRNAALNFSLEEHARVSEELHQSMCGYAL